MNSSRTLNSVKRIFRLSFRGKIMEKMRRHHNLLGVDAASRTFPKRANHSNLETSGWIKYIICIRIIFKTIFSENQITQVPISYNSAAPSNQQPKAHSRQNPRRRLQRLVMVIRLSINFQRHGSPIWMDAIRTELGKVPYCPWAG
jgi:hypothetical protein